MIKVLHVSTECYPAAKAGGMGDVVGALPLYSDSQGITAEVIIPKYDLPWFANHKFKATYNGKFYLGDEEVGFTIERLEDGALPYSFYCIDIPGKFDRDSVYLDKDGEGFKDEVQRNVSFQRAVLVWLNEKLEKYDIIHCHDHQVGLIPFFMKHGDEFNALRNQVSFYTIHNAAYRGMWDWKHKGLLPPFEEEHIGLLDWDNHIHSFATGIKNCWAYNAVSPSYLKEIGLNSGNLNWLFDNTSSKAYGILNGIDTNTWDPKSDSFIDHHLKRSWSVFKRKNKEALCKTYKLSKAGPLFSFIGRLAGQKGADILSDTIKIILNENSDCSFIVLGSGDKRLENQLINLEKEFPGKVKALIMYNEAVAHKIYAGSDFLLMPSRFEPCGLNQMFSMRYGTIPIVRSTGGLIDSVEDIQKKGTGIRFNEANTVDLKHAIFRGIELYNDSDTFNEVIKRATVQDFSWENSIKEYKRAYLKLLN